MNKDYINEVKDKYGKTNTFLDYQKKTKKYSKVKWAEVNTGLMDIINEFSKNLKNGIDNKSDSVMDLVNKLQNYISDNYYKCTSQILLSLGNMYETDERFKENIDKEVVGTAHYINQAIQNYLTKR